MSIIQEWSNTQKSMIQAGKTPDEIEQARVSLRDRLAQRMASDNQDKQAIDYTLNQFLDFYTGRV